MSEENAVVKYRCSVGTVRNKLKMVCLGMMTGGAFCSWLIISCMFKKKEKKSRKEFSSLHPLHFKWQGAHNKVHSKVCSPHSGASCTSNTCSSWWRDWAESRSLIRAETIHITELVDHLAQKIMPKKMQHFSAYAHLSGGQVNHGASRSPHQHNTKQLLMRHGPLF